MLLASVLGLSSLIGSNAKEIKERAPPALSNRTMRSLYGYRGGMCAPNFGTSRACAQMVPKNRMHRLGIGHARI